MPLTGIPGATRTGKSTASLDDVFGCNRGHNTSGAVVTRCPLRVTSRRTGASPGRSAPGGEADGIAAKADIDTRRSAVGGRADVLATWPESPLVAKTGHSTEG